MVESMQDRSEDEIHNGLEFSIMVTAIVSSVVNMAENRNYCEKCFMGSILLSLTGHIAENMGDDEKQELSSAFSKILSGSMDAENVLWN